jgi:hypothetical protein
VPDSLTCYDVRQARHRNENRTVEDQFSNEQVTRTGQAASSGYWYLTIGAVKRFCVPSNKITCTGDTRAPDVGPAELCGKTCGVGAGSPAADVEAADGCGKTCGVSAGTTAADVTTAFLCYD